MSIYSFIVSFIPLIFALFWGGEQNQRPQFCLTRDDSPQISVIRFDFNVTWIPKRPRIHYYLLAIRLRTCIFVPSLCWIIIWKTATPIRIIVLRRRRCKEKISTAIAIILIFSEYFRFWDFLRICQFKTITNSLLHHHSRIEWCHFRLIEFIFVFIFSLAQSHSHSHSRSHSHSVFVS